MNNMQERKDIAKAANKEEVPVRIIVELLLDIRGLLIKLVEK